jgi:hypothetical protein
VSAAGAAELLNTTRQTVNNRRQKGTLVGLKVGKRGFVYPLWQFAAGGTLGGLDDVLSELEALEPWTQMAFILNRNSRLGGRRPLDLLREGNIPPVVEAAAAYGRQGGS